MTARLESGSLFQYTNSRPSPHAKTSNTVVVVHGVAFNGAIFAPLALRNDVRLVTYNQAGFQGSSAIHETSARDDKERLGREYTADLVSFLEYVHNVLGVKEKVMLVCWSKGSSLGLGIADPHFLEPQLRERALARIKSIVLYEPTGNIFGLPPTNDYREIMGKTSDIDCFRRWIGGVYHHPAIPADATLQVNYATCATRNVLDTMDPALKQAEEPKTIRHGFYWRMVRTPQQQQDMAKRALTSKDVNVTVCYNGQTVGYCIEAARQARAWHARVVELSQEGNHFWFTEKPDEFLDKILLLGGEDRAVL